MLRRFGMLYQSGALWSSMTLAENIALPLGEFTDLTPAEIREVAPLKLALVGLKGFEDFYPSQISGGMQKRAGLARAMALDPDVLFFDEPSAGLDPISSQLLDDLILELRDSLGATIVVVTHELASIFAIGNNSIFLDVDTRTMIAQGNPKTLLAESTDPKVRAFLTRDAALAGGRPVSKRANPAAIGAFVVGALALAVIGLVVFGTVNLFNRPLKVVMYFDGERERPDRRRARVLPRREARHRDGDPRRGRHDAHRRLRRPRSEHARPASGATRRAPWRWRRPFETAFGRSSPCRAS